MSEKRDSNPRPQPWQGCALPTELFSHFHLNDLVALNDSQSCIRTSSVSEKRDSNPRPQPWQGCALPTELFSHFFSFYWANSLILPFCECKDNSFFLHTQVIIDKK